jgi:hypothetical protein
MGVIWIDSGRFAAAGITDPNFANVSLLLHGDGTNGSTTIVDSSSSPKTVTAVGNAQISTAQSKFGGASIAFDGTSDYLTVGTEADSIWDFGAADFTIEAWAYKVSGAFIPILAKRPAEAPTGWLFCAEQFSAHIGGDWRQSLMTASFTSGVWRHVALSRSGNVFRLFHDGVQVATATQSGVLQNLTNLFLRAGVAGGTTEVFANGFIDDLRITKGVARYTAAFTPPAAPFPDA